MTRRSNTSALLRLASHLAALAASGYLVFLAGLGVGMGPWLVPAMALHGVFLVFLFAPLHETIHRTAFRARWLNDVVAAVAGALLFLPPAYFRAFHFAHHRHTQDPARDPELAAAKPASLTAYCRHVTGLPFWFERIGTTLRHGFGRVREPFVAAPDRARLVGEARLLLAAYALAAAVSGLAESWAVALYWLGPVLLGQPALRLFLLAEHTGCPYEPNMLRNSRTTRSNALVRWFAWNMPYHAEHHAFPGIPFHALPAAHARLGAQVTVTASGYLAVHRDLLKALGAGRAVQS